MIPNNLHFSSASSLPALQFASDRAVRAATSRQAALHDVGLINRFKSGDDAAFVEIVQRYREKMFSIAFTFLRNRADADEIAQDTFIRAHRGLGAFRGDSSLVTWLHRITVNLAYNRYWHFFSRCRHLTQSIDKPLNPDNPATVADFLASDAPGPVRATTNGEFALLVTRCMERLAPGERDILTRRNVRHCSYEEISSAIGINLGTVKSRIARARKSLRGLIAKTCPEFTREMSTADYFEPVHSRTN